MIKLVLIYLFSLVSFFCRCRLSETAEEELSKSDFVFVGNVISIDKENYKDETYIRYHFEVTDNVKGIQSDMIQLLSRHGYGDCGFIFKQDKKYLVYGSKIGKNRFYTSICTRTQLYGEKAREDISQLKEIIKRRSDSK